MTTETSPKKFASWAILEVMGHVRLAGYVSEESIAGQAMIRIDVPARENVPEFTRYFGASSIYSLSPVTEEVARSVASRCDTVPVRSFDLSEQLLAKYREQAQREALPAPAVEQAEEWDEATDDDWDDMP